MLESAYCFGADTKVLLRIKGLLVGRLLEGGLCL
jgi:hypothetical protein